MVSTATGSPLKLACTITRYTVPSLWARRAGSDSFTQFYYPCNGTTKKAKTVAGNKPVRVNKELRRILAAFLAHFHVLDSISEMYCEVACTATNM